MDFDHLVTFVEIAKQGSFSRAGQKLYRSQPAVSAQTQPVRAAQTITTKADKVPLSQSDNCSVGP